MHRHPPETRTLLRFAPRPVSGPVCRRRCNSASLLGQIEAGGMGDLFLVGEEMHADLARK
jgi:hypothetical protein